MALLEIYFFGLISHTRLDKTAKRAALVKFPDHDATIFTATDEIPLKDGVHVVFQGLGSKVTLSPYFTEYVPSLAKAIQAPRYDLRGDVKSGKNNREVQAFVHLPSGDFDVADFYKYQATFYLNNVIVRQKNCVGRLALLTSIIDAREVKISVGDDVLTVPLPGWVFFANASNNNTKDFRAHRLITTAPSDTDIATVTPETDLCPLHDTWHKGVFYDAAADVARRFVDAGQVECTNTRWP